MENWPSPSSTTERFILTKEIGSGSSAMVFLAEDHFLKRKVAIKRLHPHLLNSKEAVARFKKEALAVAALSHENIVRLVDAGEIDGRLFLAMDYVEGHSLDEVIRNHEGPFTNLVSLEILVQILAGLASAHKLGIVHRDIKPSNVLVDKTGGVRLTDFGLASLAGDGTLTLTGALIGTPQYMSPEQAMGKEASAKSDVFSAGLIFYRCLTGKQAFPGKSPQEILLALSRGKLVDPYTLNPKILPVMLPILQKMLAKDLHSRIDASACLEMIQEACRLEKYVLGKKRLEDFLLDSASSKEKEEQELRASFLTKANTLREKGGHSGALKALGMAELFGFDSPAKPALSVKPFSNRKIWILVGGCIISLGFFAISFFHRAESQNLIRNQKPLVQNPLPSSIPKGQEPLLPRVNRASEIREQPMVAKITPVKQPPNLKKVPTPRKPRSPNRPEPIANGAVIAANPLPKSLGYLNVKTSPAFVQIYIDGFPVGQTPLQEPLPLRIGRHKVKIRRELWQPIDTMVTITAGKIHYLRVEMNQELSEGEIQ